MACVVMPIRKTIVVSALALTPVSTATQTPTEKHCEIRVESARVETHNTFETLTKIAAARALVQPDLTIVTFVVEETQGVTLTPTKIVEAYALAQPRPTSVATAGVTVRGVKIAQESQTEAL